MRNLDDLLTSDNIRKFCILHRLLLRGIQLPEQEWDFIGHLGTRIYKDDKLASTLLDRINQDKIGTHADLLILFEEIRANQEPLVLLPTDTLPQRMWAKSISSLRPVLGPFNSSYLHPVVPSSCGHIIADLAKMDLAKEALVNNQLIQCKDLIGDIHNVQAREAFEKARFSEMLSARIELGQALDFLETYSDQLAKQGAFKLKNNLKS